MRAQCLNSLRVLLKLVCIYVGDEGLRRNAFFKNPFSTYPGDPVFGSISSEGLFLYSVPHKRLPVFAFRFFSISQNRVEMSELKRPMIH